MNPKSLVLSAALLLNLVSASLGQNADSLVAEGRGWLVSSNIAAAKASFEAAVAQQPNHETANALLGLIRLLALPNEPGMGDFLNTAGFSQEGRNLYAWTSKPPTDTNGVLLAPATPFGGNEVKAVARNTLLPALTAATANLRKVVSPGFVLRLSAQETKITRADLDVGDLRLIQAAMYLAQYGIYTVNGWQLDAQASEIRRMYTNGTATIQGILEDFPSVGSFQSTDDLPAAKAALEAAIASYLEASEFIRNRPTTELRLFNLDPAESDAETTFRQSLMELRASLVSPQIWSVDTNYTFFARRLFENPSSPRSLLPDFVGNDIVAGTLPDATFGGVIPNLTRAEVEKLVTGPKRTGRMARVYPVLVEFDRAAGRFGFTAIDGQPYALETSTNLRSWKTVAVATCGNGRVSFSGVQPAPTGSSFYRLRDLGSIVSAKGRVVALPSSAPVAGAVVKLKVYDWITEENRTFSGVTSRTGEFQILTDAEWFDWDGYYQLEVTAPGYPTATYGGGSTPNIETTLYVANPPPNDSFENRSPLSGLMTSAFGWSANGSARSWWEWTAPRDGGVTATIEGAPNCYISVATGTVRTNLSWIAGETGEVAFAVKAGTAYNISVDPYDGGSYDLKLVFSPPPANDAFANKQTISGPSAFFRATNLGATVEPGENNTDQASVWWSWTASETGGVEISAQGGSESSVAVFTGTGLQSLSLIREDYDGVRFQAVAGTTYQIRVSEAYGSGGGSFRFKLRPIEPPANDAFENRELLSTLYSSAEGYTFGATKQPGEPDHAWTSGGHSVWWEWTSSTSRNMVLEVYGDEFPVVVSVYTGTTLNNLTMVAADEGGLSGHSARVTFAAKSGVRYLIAVDGKDGATGEFELYLRPAQ